MKKIVAACPAGLGNRIKCMVSTIMDCDEYIDKGIKANPYIYWPVNDACGCEFEDLFDKETLLEELFKGEFDSIPVEVYNGNVKINKSWKLQSNKIQDIDFKYHKLSKAQINNILPYFWYIRPKEDIQDAAWTFFNQYRESFNKGEVVGVHIRKGDFKGLYDGRANISQESDFIEKIRCLLEVNPDYKFLLCTEDEATEERFRKRFGSKHIIYFPKRFRERNTTNSIKEAFVDILLLSKCSIIIGTFLSTFTEIAWWFGGCKARVVIPGTNDKKAMSRVMAKLPREGEGKYKKILRRINIFLKEKQ